MFQDSARKTVEESPKRPPPTLTVPTSFLSGINIAVLETHRMQERKVDAADIDAELARVHFPEQLIAPTRQWLLQQGVTSSGDFPGVDIEAPSLVKIVSLPVSRQKIKRCFGLSLLVLLSILIVLACPLFSV